MLKQWLTLLGVCLCITPAQAQDDLEVIGIAQPWQFGFQEPVTPLAMQMVDFHNLLLVIVTGILIFVFSLLTYVMVRFRKSANPVPQKFSHNVALEILWTSIPVLILLSISVPSFLLIYAQHRVENTEMTVKVIGNQWYWTYEYPDHNEISFSSYLIPESELKAGQKRLLDVDKPLVLPVNTKIRVLVTANDVLHSFAVPAFGIKIDAVPGRLNEIWIEVVKPGIYYGQCSELCGELHAYMPIVVHAIEKDAFDQWTQQQS